MICVLIALGLLALPDLAEATTRYATPGGSADDSQCVTPAAAKCSLVEAVTGNEVASDDEVVVAPGTYGNTDLGGGTLNIASGLDVHGTAGAPKPVIAPTHGGLFGVTIGGSAQLDFVDIDGTAFAGFPVKVDAGTLSRSLVVSNLSNTPACFVNRGTIRDSICKATGSDQASGIALTETPSFTQLHETSLRNVTALSTNFYGITASYDIRSARINANSVIAEGGTGDVLLETNSNLQFHYAFSMLDAPVTGQNGTIIIDDMGANTTADPVFAANGYSQASGSPSIEAGGDVGASSGDFEGDDRLIGSHVDIGGDEYSHPTAILFGVAGTGCSPASTTVSGANPTCTAEVVDDALNPQTPTGSLTFSSDGPGAFAPHSHTCTLAPSSNGASCSITYNPTAVGDGTHSVTATYIDDTAHDSSSNTFTVSVSSDPVVPDTTPPETIGISGPKGKRKPKREKLVFESNEPGTFTCARDKRAAKPCTSPLRLKKLPPGRHKVVITATDLAGNSDPTPLLYKWKVKKKHHH